MRNYFNIMLIWSLYSLWTFLQCWYCAISIKWAVAECEMPMSSEKPSPLVVVDGSRFLHFMQSYRSLPSGAAQECRTHPSDAQIKQSICKVALKGKFWPVILIIAFLLPSNFVLWLWQCLEMKGILMATTDVFIMRIMTFYASLKALAVKIQGFPESRSSQWRNPPCISIFLAVKKSLKT